jgi:hypothetical protein
VHKGEIEVRQRECKMTKKKEAENDASKAQVSEEERCTSKERNA